MTDKGFSPDCAPNARLTIAGRSFRSRLMLGTGKYRSPEIMAACHRESGAEIITVTVRRVNLADASKTPSSAT
jgi:thiazole synthase